MKKRTTILLCVSFSCLFACKKNWLDEKRDLNIVVPTSISDMRKLLNETNVFWNDYRGLAVIAGDEFSTPDQVLNAQSWRTGNLAYVWADDVFEGSSNVSAWDGPYKQIFYTNVVLEGLSKLSPQQHELIEYNDVKGGALFFRARAFYALTVHFTAPYKQSSPIDALGIPLRLHSDIYAKVERNTLVETYQQTIADLRQAAALLGTHPQVKTDASKQAAFALLARICLSVADYENAFLYADSCLAIQNNLMDFNQLDLNIRFPIPMNNEEIILEATMQPSAAIISPTNGLINEELLHLYDVDDLRREVFFQENQTGGYGFRGMYNGRSGLFAGLAVDEILLIRAESAARLGWNDDALSDLNRLLQSRYKTNTFLPRNTNSDLLNGILAERRKELLMRGLRWEDLRRLNLEPEAAIMLKRMVNGEQHDLLPNSDRYTFRIPQYIVDDTGIQQNN